MCTVWTHAFVGLALGRLQTTRPMPARYWLLSGLLAAAPDLDAVGFWFGVPYESLLGHRGLTHSIPFAAFIASLVVLLAFRDPQPISRWRVWLQLFLATASHGLFDMLTDGGLGIALWSPFITDRLFFPWTPIEVAPLYPSDFFSHWGWQVVCNEAVWVMLPVIGVAGAVELVRNTVGRGN